MVFNFKATRLAPAVAVLQSKICTKASSTSSLNILAANTALLCEPLNFPEIVITKFSLHFLNASKNSCGEGQAVVILFFVAFIFSLSSSKSIFLSIISSFSIMILNGTLSMFSS